GAAFALGIMIGRGGDADQLVIRRDGGVVTEAAMVDGGKSEEASIVELGVTSTDLSAEEVLDPLAVPPAPVTETTTTAQDQTATFEISTAATAEPTTAAPVAEKPAPTPAPVATAPAVTHYVQLFSSGDGKAAEALAAKVIDAGFTSTFVERIPGEHGTIYRVRVKYPSEESARAAAEKLKAYVKAEPWVTKQ
ncbi:MAG: SPOR domain-containing protein, partial [Thermoanaerobaculia bacterium]